MLRPKRTGSPIWVPPKPPVKSALPNSTSSTALPSPRVTIARLIPRVRTAGRPNRTPSGIVATIPIRMPTQEGDVGRRQESAGDVGAEAGEGELRQRELAGVAGEDDDR